MQPLSFVYTQNAHKRGRERNKGYRSINNFKFALKSNAKRIKRVTQALNKASIRDILSKKNVGYGLMSTILQGLLL